MSKNNKEKQSLYPLLSIDETTERLCRIFKNVEHARNCSNNGSKNAVITVGELVNLYGKDICTGEVINSHKSHRGGETLSECVSRLAHFLLMTKTLPEIKTCR